MEKTKYKKEIKVLKDTRETLKTKMKIAKEKYKESRQPFKIRLKKFIKPEHYRISGFFHVRREYKELKKNFNYIMSSLKVINLSAENEDQIRTEIEELIDFVS